MQEQVCWQLSELSKSRSGAHVKLQSGAHVKAAYPAPNIVVMRWTATSPHPAAATQPATLGQASNWREVLSLSSWKALKLRNKLDKETICTSCRSERPYCYMIAKVGRPSWFLSKAVVAIFSSCLPTVLYLVFRRP